jgi:hypothetical protein
MPSIEREPLPRSALSSARLWPCVGPAALPPRCRLSTPLARPNLAVRPGLIPVHAPRCHRVALLWISASLADFCNRVTTRGHTLRALRSSHASGALAPLLAGIGRCRLRRPHDALPHRQPASHDQHATACASRVPLGVDGADHGPKHPREGMSALLGRTLRVPSSKYSVHPCYRHDSSRTLERFASRRAGRDPPTDAPSRKGAALGGSGCLQPSRNSYANGGALLSRARPNRSPVTPPPQRHCSRAHAPFRPRRCACF